jgi:ApaG protein
MNSTQSQNIEVKVKTQYIGQQQQQNQNHYLFAYTINISNHGDTPTRLMSRHWLICDTDGKIQEVFGEGVVGKQPYIQPGASFEYTSSAMIKTAVGSMEGSYQMICDNGESFSTPIPKFSLSIPRTLH